MGSIHLYTVEYLACKLSCIGTQTRHGVYTILAADGNQALNSLLPQIEDEFPEKDGWRVECEAHRVKGQLIELLVSEWGWVRKEGV